MLLAIVGAGSVVVTADEWNGRPARKPFATPPINWLRPAPLDVAWGPRIPFGGSPETDDCCRCCPLFPFRTQDDHKGHLIVLKVTLLDISLLPRGPDRRHS